jgi:DNA-binding MarR family transcriptional regulator
METVSNVNDQVMELLVLLRQLIRTRSIRDPIAEMYPHFTAPQMHAMLCLGMEAHEGGDGGLNISVIAQRVSASVPTMTGVIDRLERDGYVQRDRHATDRRVVLVTLTEAGRKVHQLALEDIVVKLSEFLGALTATERTSFVATMHRAVHVLTAAKSSTPDPTEGSSS